MNKLLLWAILGFVGLVVGGMLLAYSNYLTQVSESIYFGNGACGSYYTTSYNKSTGLYTDNYTPGYYSCEANVTAVQNKEQLLSNEMDIPGWGLVLGGGITLIIALIGLVVAAYREHIGAINAKIKTKK